MNKLPMVTASTGDNGTIFRTQFPAENGIEAFTVQSNPVVMDPKQVELTLAYMVHIVKEIHERTKT